MDGLSFLTPAAALVGLAGVLPLAALALLRRRARRVRSALGLGSSVPRETALLLSLAAVPALLGLAAAQPVLAVGGSEHERADVEAWFVLDTSRSMLAAAGPDLPTRYERAAAAAEAVRVRLPELRVGLASLTDRLLPHLFPTADGRLFSSTIARSMGIERPPPSAFYETSATRLEALAALANRGYYRPGNRTRVAVVFTDGESRPVGPALRRALRRGRGVRLVLVRLWGENERVYGADGGEEEYRPDRASGAALARIAAQLEASVLAADEVDQTVAAIRAAAGTGGELRERPRDRVSLAFWLTAAAFVPLGLVLSRRNV